jgi:hypothetical protein
MYWLTQTPVFSKIFSRYEYQPLSHFCISLTSLCSPVKEERKTNCQIIDLAKDTYMDGFWYG